VGASGGQGFAPPPWSGRAFRGQGVGGLFEGASKTAAPAVGKCNSMSAVRSTGGNSGSLVCLLLEEKVAAEGGRMWWIRCESNGLVERLFHLISLLRRQLPLKGKPEEGCMLGLCLLLEEKVAAEGGRMWWMRWESDGLVERLFHLISLLRRQLPLKGKPTQLSVGATIGRPFALVSCCLKG